MKKKKGFSLIEVIVAILTTVIIPQFSRSIKNQKKIWAFLKSRCNFTKIMKIPRRNYN